MKIKKEIIENLETKGTSTEISFEQSTYEEELIDFKGNYPLIAKKLIDAEVL
jgi:hypothetical protein